MMVISLIYYGTIPFQYLNTVIAMQDSTFLGTVSQFIFVKGAARMWKWGGKSEQRRIHCFVLSGACVIDYY